MPTPSWKSLTLLASLALLPACGDESPMAGAQEPARGTASPLASPAAGKFRKSPDAVPGQYIVVLKGTEPGTANVPEVAEAHARPHGATVTQTYSHALRGYVVRTHEAAARAIAARPEVDYVVEDVRTYPTTTQSNAPWNLDRIDQITWTFPRWGDYTYSATGAGVHVYVIDSGIKTSHPDFGGRATGDYTAIQDGRGADDCTGHGTHVAGTVGGTQWGVAKGVRLHAVRVSGCAGDPNNTASKIIAGVDWVTANHVKPAVANMSLTVGYVAFEPVDTAVRNSIAAGVVYVVAAGNENIDACTRSPARVAEAITVGATTDGDTTRLSDSNYGTCVDLFAPGLLVTSAALDGTSTYMSGTSMASPHVAGVAALYLASNPSAAPATVRTAVVYNSPDNKVANAGSGSPTRMLHSTPLTTCGRLSSGESLNAGRTLPACTGQGRLIHQTDGNVVIYDRLGALWSTATWNTTSSTFIMQTDGNLVLYSGTGSVLWSIWGGGNAGAYLRLQDNCNLVLYSASGAQLWQTGTTCR